MTGNWLQRSGCADRRDEEISVTVAYRREPDANDLLILVNKTAFRSWNLKSNTNTSLNQDG
ncbi:hypothetical protein [Spirosoma sp. KNUC1025]|uniref:hypothetical protein n=1 Tax=Spirosoma sp. KNUC1025 TaxID=2894082 RepID=UPI00386828C5|nr:hypothetical protein LN737_20365 [Spirosoma sp. KNUC1025]